MQKAGKRELKAIIDRIQYEKQNIIEKDIREYYKLMYLIKGDTATTLIDFIIELAQEQVNKFFDIEDVTTDTPLLTLEGELSHYWVEWSTNLITDAEQDNKRFNEFRDYCYVREKEISGVGDILYRDTRLFIIRKAILKSIDEIKIYLYSRRYKDGRDRLNAEKYIRASYMKYNEEMTIKICSYCGYPTELDGKSINHSSCGAYKSEVVTLPPYSAILRPAIHRDIVKPGKFEIEVHDRLIESFSEATVIIYPYIETYGDISIQLIGMDKPIYLDMKAFNDAISLKDELTKETNKKDLKSKYKNRWIIVPSLHYLEQSDLLKDILEKNNSRIYDIDRLIKELKYEEKKLRKINK
jgi:hypothetical protein